MEGSVIDAIANAPEALMEIWSMIGGAAWLTAPLPPHAVAIALMCATIRLLADFVAIEAADLRP